nr:hypothetical protein [Tanacetum cinerariifolium]
IPSGEIKVHIEVLSVLWGNRLPIRTVRCRCLDGYYDLEGDILYLESLLNDDLVHRDPSIPAMSVASILEGFIDEPPLEENDDLFDLESKNDEWKKILYNAQIDDLMISPDLEVSSAHGFVHRLLELQSLAYGNPIS